MYVTLETALLVFPGQGTTDVTEVFDIWSETPRTAFFVNWNDADIETAFMPVSDSRVVRLSTEFESVSGTTPILAEMRRRNIRRLLFLGGDIEGAVETNLRAIAGVGTYCLLLDGIDVHGLEAADVFRMRVGRYCDLVTLETLKREIPLDVRCFS